MRSMHSLGNATANSRNGVFIRKPTTGGKFDLEPVPKDKVRDRQPPHVFGNGRGTLQSSHTKH